MRKSINKIHMPGLAALAAYIFFISWRLFFYAYANNYRRMMTDISYNIIPFKTIINYVSNSGNIDFSIWIYNLIGNVIAFLPLGFLLPFAFRRLGAAKTFTVAFILILAAEIMQLISRRGVFDVDDIVLNMLGSLIGYGMYKLLSTLLIKGRRLLL